MILFLEDWQKYPTAIVDEDTPNRSWYRLAKLYEEMGIANHAFILALINPDLKGIDPHSPYLSLETQLAIAWECKINPWYFFREVARAPGVGTPVPGPVEANRGNIALWWSFFNHITIILIQIRQTGKSFSTDVLMTYLLNFLCAGTQINLITKDDTLRKANVERMKSVAADLPPYLNQRTKTDASNTEEITINSLGNKYKTHVPQASKKLAYNMGRGLTSAIMQFDEAPFQSNIAISMPAALAATGAAVDAARRDGTPYGTIITTTAGKKDDPDGKFIYDIVSSSAVWNEGAFFDCQNEEELVRRVMGSSTPWPGEKKVTRAIINATFNHRQLGKSDEWLADKIARALVSGDDANRDFFNMWTSGSLTNPIPTHLLEKMRQNQSDVLYNAIDPKHGYITRWYVPENQLSWVMQNHKCIMALDTSDAIGRDGISMVIVDTESFGVLGAGLFNETNVIEFAMWLTDVIIQYPNLTTIIERRSTGSSILDHLIHWLVARGVDPFARLFNWVVNDRDEYPDRYREIMVPMSRRDPEVYTKYREFFGFATSGSGQQSRHELYGRTLMLAAKHGADRMHDQMLISQTTQLTTRNGRIDHASGGHDDMVVAWLLSYWILSNGRNLEFYGIERNGVLSNVMKERVQQTSSVQKQEQLALRERIKSLYDMLLKENDDLISARYETELRTLDKKLILELGEVHSVDQMIHNAGETRRSRRRSFDRTSLERDNRNEPREVSYAEAMIAANGSQSYNAYRSLSHYR